MTQQIRNAVTLTVDGREVVAPEGSMLVDAAKGGDIEIPVFCYEPKLGEPVGACRMCMVEVEGIPKLQTACSTPVRDGMVVYTQTERVKEAQNAVVEFLLVNHPLDCPVCDKGGECPLQDVAMGWGPGNTRMTDPKRHFPKPLELSPLVAIDRERCILCYRCVRFSQEIAEDEQLQLLERGDRSYVGTYDERPYIAPFHGNITELCPVGALTSYTYRFRARPWDIEDAGSVCTLCPSQCNVKFTVRDEKVMRVLARDNHEVDDGWLCDKGRFGFQMIGSEERITEPMQRGGDGTLTPISWDDALKRISSGLQAAGEHSAALVGGGTSNEEGWLIGKLFREALGSADITSSAEPIDANLLRDLSRPEMAIKVSDLGHADAIFVVGCDPLQEAPILDLRIRKAVRMEHSRLSVASERPTALDGGAETAARYAPGEATALLGAVAAKLGAPGFEAADEYAEDAEAIAESLKAVPDPAIVWGERLWRTPGAVEALLACANALDITSKVGAGLMEIPAASNARGLREVGCLPGSGPGLSEAPAGRNANEIRDALNAGETTAVLLSEADPIGTFPDSKAWSSAFAKATLVVSIATHDDRSTKLANIVLPAESHAEKDGTVTHPDGRLQRVRPGIARSGELRPGWQWLSELTKTLGKDLGLNTSAEVLAALAAEVPFYEGITDEEIGGSGVRWQDRPAASTSPTGGSPRPAAPATGAPDGLVLGTYPNLWASEVTRNNPALRFLDPAQQLELSIDDAKRLEVQHGDRVKVSANGSSVEASVSVRARQPAGAAFLIEGTTEGNANLLTNGRPQAIEVVKAGAKPAAESGATAE